MRGAAPSDSCSIPAAHAASRRSSRGARGRALCLLASLVVASSSAAAAPARRDLPAREVTADVEEAEQLYAHLEYEEANKVAERASKQRGLSHDPLVRVYRILAITYAVLDRSEASRDAFIALLAYDPDFQADPNLGPRVSTPFLEARGFWRAQPVRPGLEVAVTLRADEPGAIRVVTRDPLHVVKRVVVGTRWGQAGDFVVTAVAASPVAPSVADVPPPPAGRARLDYYAQALDERDDVVFESGNPGTPRSALVEATRPSPFGGSGYGRDGGAKRGSIFASPVFWTVAAVVVAGGATAVFFAARGKDDPTSATLAPTVSCGLGTRCQ